MRGVRVPRYWIFVLTLVFSVPSIEAQSQTDKAIWLLEHKQIKGEKLLPVPAALLVLFPRLDRQYDVAYSAFSEAWQRLSGSKGIGAKINNYETIVSARSVVVSLLVNVRPIVEQHAHAATDEIQQLVDQGVSEVQQAADERDALSNLEKRLDAVVPSEGGRCLGNVAWPAELQTDVQVALAGRLDLACTETRPRKQKQRRIELFRALWRYLKAADLRIPELQREVRAVQDQIATSRSGLMRKLEPMLAVAIDKNLELRDRDCRKLQELYDILGSRARTDKCPP